MKDKLDKSLVDRIDDEFTLVAFAEENDLYPAHPHRVRSLTEVFSEVAFAESGERELETPEALPAPQVCVLGESKGGLCV